MNKNNKEFLIKTLNDINENIIKCEQLLYLTALTESMKPQYNIHRTKLHNAKLLINDILMYEQEYKQYMNNLPILLKIEKTSLDDFEITIYNQLNGVTQSPEIIFIKRDKRFVFNSAYESYNETIIEFLEILNDIKFI